MQILRDPSQLGLVKDAYISDLIAQRFQEITIDGYSYDELGMFVLVEPGDSVADLEQAGGIWITTGLFSDAKYGDSDFAPCHEILEWHVGHCFEMVHILNDSGYGVITIIPEEAAIDAELSRYCREYAEPAPTIPRFITGDSYAPGG